MKKYKIGYTQGVYDISYYQPLFGVIITIAGAFNCFRIPYETIVKSAGFFKQTRNGSFFEAGLNISLSIVLAIKFGLIGVAIGTLAATLFRTFQFAFFLSKNVLKRSMSLFVNRLLLSFLTAFTVYAIYRRIPIPTDTIGGWVLMVTLLTILATTITVIINMAFYKEDFLLLVSKFKLVLKRRRKK